MNIKDRFTIFIEYKRLSKRKFQESIGVSNSYIQNITNSIGADVLNRIISTYPELNTQWLIYGKGEMLNTNSSEIDTTKPSVPYEFVQAMIEERKRHDDERKRHDEMNAELIRQNGELIEMLQERKKTDAHLEDDAICATAKESGLAG